MFQQEVEELFFLQTGAFIVTYVTSWWEWSGAFKSWSQPVIYSDLPLAHTLCPAVPFNTAQALERFLSNISITVCFPICRVLLRLVERCLPCRESAKLRSSAFPNQTDNLCLRCFSRKSKNYSFSRLVPSLLRHGGGWSLVCLPHIMPGCAFQDCTSTWVLFATEYFKHSMLPHLQSVAKTVVPGRALPALQRECQLGSSAFPNKTDNLSLRCFSRKSKNCSFSKLVPSLLHMLHHGGSDRVPSNPGANQ